jgi:2-C-methyl-D-erythritol 2,4-cyclodiphosphate synthase
MRSQFAARLVIGMTSYGLRIGVSAGARLSQIQRSQPFCIGHGYDLHRLQTGGRLVLAGIEVSRDLSPVAHSDGDVVLHAIVDALCGALGLGDIGEHFPNTDLRWKDAPSHTFVEEIYARITAAGYIVGNLDVTILAERPKLRDFKPAMRKSLAELLRITIEQVNVKAGTNEGCDAIGRGEAIAAHAVVLLARSA